MTITIEAIFYSSVWQGKTEVFTLPIKEEKCVRMLWCLRKCKLTIANQSSMQFY